MHGKSTDAGVRYRCVKALQQYWGLLQALLLQ